MVRSSEDRRDSPAEGTADVIAHVRAWLGPNGRLRTLIPHFQYRPEQLRMAAAVARCYTEGGRLLVEAGTGTGKTFAYILPALIRHRRLLIATGTIPLQEQLYTKDLPILQKAFPCTAQLLKGRQHYLCLWKWDRLQRHPPLHAVHSDAWQALRTWVQSTSTGDRAECTELAEDHPLWRDIAADAETCMGARCRFFQDCFLYRARRRAEQADIVIVNQHLLLADARVRHLRDTAILPDVDTLVIDEAHMLEDNAMSALSLELSYFTVMRLFREMQTTLEQRERVSNRVLRGLRRFMHETRAHLLQVFALPTTLSEHRIGWEPLVAAVPELPTWLQQLHETLAAFADWIESLPPSALPVEERDQFFTWTTDLVAMVRTLLEPDTNTPFVRYAEFNPQTHLPEARWSLHITPVHVGPVLRDILWPRFSAVVLTSATLAYRRAFAYVIDRLGIGSPTSETPIRTLRVASPFRLAQQTRLWVPRDLPDPRDPDYLPRMLPDLERLIRLVRGATLVLCTSLHHMHAVAAYLQEHIPWPVYVQGTAPRRFLMDRFRTHTDSVLVATTSFWQGFDVPGESLRCVVIDKLPFDVPNDPIVQAQIAQIRQEGRSPFHTFQLPRAVMLLRQGLGRLIRTETDTGILAIMDSRIWTRHYGSIIRRELAPLRIVSNWEDLQRWWQTRATHASPQADVSRGGSRSSA